MSIKGILIFGIMATAMLLSSPAICDTFYMKSGATLKGSIISEKNDVIELNIGYGTINIERSEILKIEKSRPIDHKRAEKIKRQRTFVSGKYIPSGAEQLSSYLRTTLAKRRLAVKAGAHRAELGDELKILDEDITELRKNSFSFSDLFNTFSRGHRHKEPIVITEDMQKNAKLLESKEARQRELKSLVDKDDERVQDYKDAYIRFMDYLGGDGKQTTSLRAQGIEGEYYDWVRDTIELMRSDFRTDVIPYLNLAGYQIISAKINGAVSARLRMNPLDDNTTLNQNIIDKLDPDPDTAVGTVDFILLPERRNVRANIYQFRSIQVGHSMVDGIKAAAIPNESSAFDGQLGKSFFSHFDVSIDTTAETLTLFSFKGPDKGPEDPDN